MLNNNLPLIIILLLSLGIFKGQEKQISYKELYDIFDSYEENDVRAMVFVNMYISKAKVEGNLKKMIVGYEESIYYNPIADQKLIYSDSAITYAIKLQDTVQIARAYLGKGIIYHYNFRNYKNAIKEYLKAFQYSKKSKDPYLKNKVNYHLAIVKYYLGYYAEASEHFTQTAKYFEGSLRSGNIHYNDKFNYESGYFNSIYRLSRCYYNLQLFKKEDSLINIGLNVINDIDQHAIEYAYFQKAVGIQYLRKSKYDSALKHLIISRNILNHRGDYASLATVDFNLGVLYWNMGKRNMSMFYFNKVDSIARRSKLIMPEVRAAYKYLITDAKANKDHKRSDHFGNLLLKADSTIIADFPELTSRIRYEYDTEYFFDEKRSLIEEKKNSKFFFLISFLSATIIFLLIVYKYKMKEKKLNSQYKKLLIRLRQDKESGVVSSNFAELDMTNIDIRDQVDQSFTEQKKNDDEKESYFKFDEKSNHKDHHKGILEDVVENANSKLKEKYDREMISNVLKKLKIFEEKEKFLQKNLKMPDVALKLGTNRSILSYVINEHLKIPYPDYIKTLRIRYITDLMIEDKKYLQYNIKSLADICGMSSRQIFTLQFRQINGMSPTDFINQRLKDLNDQ